MNHSWIGVCFQLRLASADSRPQTVCRGEQHCWTPTENRTGWPDFKSFLSNYSHILHLWQCFQDILVKLQDNAGENRHYFTVSKKKIEWIMIQKIYQNHLIVQNDKKQSKPHKCWLHPTHSVPLHVMKLCLNYSNVFKNDQALTCDPFFKELFHLQ